MAPLEDQPSADAADYTVRVDGAGLQMERKVSERVALAVIAAMMQGVTSPRVTRGAPALIDPRPGEETTVGEFVSQRNAKRNPDKIAAFAYYLKHSKAVENFSRDEIREMFANAGEVPPANFPRDFNWTVANKWIAQRGPGEYFITKTGEDAVRSGFATEVRRATRQGSRRRSRSRGASTAAPSHGSPSE